MRNVFSIGTAGLALIGLAAGLGGLAAPSPALANKPLIGVACGSGFFVRAPTKKVYWIHGEPLERTVAFDGGDKLIALAECGSGVASVFAEPGEGGHTRVFQSPDCLNIGAAAGGTRLVHEAVEPVKSLSIEGEMLTIVLASGATHAVAACTRD